MEIMQVTEKPFHHRSHRGTRRKPVPAGTGENRPARQCRMGKGKKKQVPLGTAENLGRRKISWIVVKRPPFASLEGTLRNTKENQNQNSPQRPQRLAEKDLDVEE